MEPDPEGHVTVSYEYTIPALEPRLLESGLRVAPPPGGSLVYESPPLTTEEPHFLPEVQRSNKESLFIVQQYKTSEHSNDIERKKIMIHNHI